MNVNDFARSKVYILNIDGEIPFIDANEKFSWNNFGVHHLNRIENHAQEQLRTAPSMFKVKLPRADAKASWGRCGHCPRARAAQCGQIFHTLRSYFK